MKNVTKFFSLVLLLALWALPASAQDKNVTFQVDMNAALDACQLVPDDGDLVEIRGTLNDWSTPGDALTDDDDDGIYTGTFAIAAAEEVTYKFWTTKLEFEDNIGGGNDNRVYTVTDDADQEVEVVDFNKATPDICNAIIANYEIEFQVDMSVAALNPTRFNPDAGDIVMVAGGDINGWSNTSDTLTQDFINPNIYSKVIQVENFAAPAETAFKFIIGKAADESPQGWEGVPDRKISLDGTEADVDNNGFLDVTFGPVFFDNVTPDQILTEETTVTFTVDLRPAFYFLEDNGELPADTQTGEVIDEVTGVWINGPAAGAGDGLVDWATWGPDLAAIPSRALLDDGTNGDAVAGDSIYTLQFAYQPGTAINIAGKFGLSGFDNEAGFGFNQNFIIEPFSAKAGAAEAVVSSVFGAMRLSDGTFFDDCGPGAANSPDDCTGGEQWDPYIVIDNTQSPPTVEVVRSGGGEDTNTAIEVLDDEVPSQITLSPNFPNPFNPSTTFDYTIAETQQVTVRVYDMLGRVVATLVDGVQPASTYRVSFDATNLASGTYLYRLETATAVISRTMVLLK